MRRSPYRAAVLLAAVSTAALSSGVSSQVAQSASMNLTAHVRPSGDCNGVTDTGADAWGVLLSGLTVKASATKIDCNTQGSISAFGNGLATWISAAAGNVTFRGVGFTFDNAQGLASTNTGGVDWTYEFMATNNGTFSMDGNVTGSGDVFGLWGWAVSLAGGPEVSQSRALPPSSAFDPNDTWNFTGGITAGNVYDVTLSNNANIELQGVGSLSGQMDGVFNWQIKDQQIVTTPEPATLALIFPGLLAAAIVRRKRDTRNRRR